MGCSASKPQDLPLVVRCRERRKLIRAAADYRYALAAAHVSYFQSLKDVGEALRKFVDDDLVSSSISPSVSSPSLILPPTSKRKGEKAEKFHLRENGDDSHLHLSDSTSSSSDDSDFDDFKHNHLSQHDTDSGHKYLNPNDHQLNGKAAHRRDEGEFLAHYAPGGFNSYVPSYGDGFIPYSYPQGHRGEPFMDQWNQPGLPPPMQPWHYSTSSHVYYMSKSAPEVRTVVQEPPPEPTHGFSDSYWNPGGGYGGNDRHFSWASPEGMRNNERLKVSPEKEVLAPPSPKASVWDFFNPFDVYNNDYSLYYSSGVHGYRSNNSSPDSIELREREGIPDLEEDTEVEVSKESLSGKTVKREARTYGHSLPSSRAMPGPKYSDSKSMPLGKSQSSSKSVPSGKKRVSSRPMLSLSSDESEKPSMPSTDSGARTRKSNSSGYFEESIESSISPPKKKETSSLDISSSVSVIFTDEKSSHDAFVSKSVDESSVSKKKVSFEVEETSIQDDESSKLSSVTILSPCGTRELQEVVAEIRDDFEIAYSYGKEVAKMLEVGKFPPQPSFLKAVLSGVFCHIIPSLSRQDPSLKRYVKSASRTMKLAKSYFEDVDKDVNGKACNLSSTLDKLYAWEKKLYKEVKGEERLRLIYEKQCKRLKVLDQGGADSSKLDAAQASIRKLLTKLDVSIKAIDTISSRIHKLRDEELQPQVAALIHGLVRMWKSMFKCHQKQFQAIMESKMRKLKANNTLLPTDLGLSATSELERELSLWCDRFRDWVGFQKSYVESLNGWLLQCLQYEPEQTPDGPVPYSPGQLGAPLLFIICNDWHQAMKAISEARVAKAMNTFITKVRQLGEKQDEEGRQRLKAEYLSKDYVKHLKPQGMNGKKIEREQDVISHKTGFSLVPSDNGGVSSLDDLKVDLDSMRRRLAEERIKHKDAKKSVHDAASSSLQGGLVPIFKALENFTSDAVASHERVRLKHPTLP